MIRIEMLPANYGDSIWIEYGNEGETPRRILIDGGFKGTYRRVMRRVDPEAQRQFELIALTHIDEDHIKGAIPLLGDPRLNPAAVGDVWFNGWKHVKPTEPERSPLQGEFFSALLDSRGFRWNAAWDGGAVVLPEHGSLPEIELEGGLRLTLLSPSSAQLQELGHYWKTEVEEGGFVPGDAASMLDALSERPALQPDTVRSLNIDVLADADEDEDSSIPNGSSIAMLAEFGGVAALLSGDAHPSVLVAAIDRLLADRGDDRLRLDALKVAHHGSAHNTNTELLERIDCRQFLISSNGKRFGHPAPECIARLITHRPDEVTLRFNYRSAINEAWSDPILQGEYDYRAIYPENSGQVLTLNT
jgi:hypothetical protein